MFLLYPNRIIRVSSICFGFIRLLFGSFAIHERLWPIIQNCLQFCDVTTSFKVKQKIQCNVTEKINLIHYPKILYNLQDTKVKFKISRSIYAYLLVKLISLSAEFVVLMILFHGFGTNNCALYFFTLVHAQTK